MTSVVVALGVTGAVAFAAEPVSPRLGASGRPLNGSGNAPGGRGRAGDTFIRIDGFEPPPANAPRARELSNQFFAEPPLPGIGTFETVLIPFEDLRTGPRPDRRRLNQLAVAFGQAVAHDMAKSRLGFDPSALGNSDFHYAPEDPICQKLVEVDTTTIYFLPCTASHASDGELTTVSLGEGAGYTLVEGTTWTYGTGPIELTVANGAFVHRQVTFPLVSVLSDEGMPFNDVTSFLDLSIIYGNDTTVNGLLRANDGSGQLETAADGDIPFGKPGLANDCSAFDPVNNPTSASGDARVDENLFLEGIHSLLFRNHNRDARWLYTHRPDLRTDEAIFQRARAINIARYQQQVYNEYLPAVFGGLAVERYISPYRGYVPGTDPRISTSYDIALRVAHGQVALPPYVVREDGTPFRVEGILGFPSHARPNCLFVEFRAVGGKAVIASAIEQFAQEVTGEVSDLMRNVVFRAGNGQRTSAFNLDIEQLNIIRARDFGMPNYDTLRKTWRGRSVYDLPGCRRAPDGKKDRLRCFSRVARDLGVARRLREVYDHVDEIDAFVGLMLESDGDARYFFMPQTATAIILEQFERTRDADRYFYLNQANPELDFSPAEWKRINESVAESIAASYGVHVQDAFRVPTTGRRADARKRSTAR